MCGIFALLARNFGSKYKLSELFQKIALIQGRGPDRTAIQSINDRLLFGFHRLAINDMSILAEQPMTLSSEDGQLHLICNGEIYNHLSLKQEYGFQTQSGSDCEIILHLYRELGDIQQVAQRLDGVFAFTLYDAHKDVLFAARDAIGVRPLFIGFDDKNDGIILASESKCCIGLVDRVQQFPPGSTWSSAAPHQYDRWWNLQNVMQPDDRMISTEEEALKTVHDNLVEATQKRLMSERPIGSFLSGGLDSSLITALVSRLNPYTVNTYSVGMEGATDFKFAAKVAEHLKTNHHEIVFTPEQGIDALERVIYALETYDVTTIRASIGMYLMSEHIKEHSDDIVVYSGEGADEVTQGYLYFHNAPSVKESSLDSQRLLENLHYFDVKRVDRTVMTHGLEVRVPFLDKQFMTDFFRIDPVLRAPSYRGIEKWLVRKAFDRDELLPSDVLWRTKEALSDGVSSLEEPWHVIIGRHVDRKVSDEEFERGQAIYAETGNGNVPMHKEAYFYRKLYEKHFAGTDLVPYYWMPQWSDATDPSARTIGRYEQLVGPPRLPGTDDL